MQLRPLGLEGLVGALIFLAGAHLLWKSREIAIAWLREFFRVLRGEFARKSGGASPVAAVRRPRAGALTLVGAIVLILLGQILFFLNLTY